MNRRTQTISAGTRAKQASPLWGDDTGRTRTLLVVLLITLVGVLLRMISVNSRGLWLDEAATVIQAKRSLPLVIQTIASGVHPPLFHILVHYWIKLFGATETAVRGFAVMWGVLSIPAAYWATRVAYDRRSGLIAAVIVALSPYAIWYSQEARMYSMMMFFGFLSVGFLMLAVRDNRTRHWVGYTIATLLGMFSHYFFAFLVLGEGLYFVVMEVLVAHGRLKRSRRAVFSWTRPLSLLIELPKLKPWLISMVVLGSSYMVWLNRSVFFGSTQSPLIASATGQGLGYGQAAPHLALRFNDVGRVVVEMLLGFQPLPFTFAMVATWPLVISATLVLFDYMGFLARRSVVAIWAALGLIVIAVLGQWQGQVLASRYFIALTAPVVILSAGVLGAMPTVRRRGVLIVCSVLCLAAWFSQSYNPDNSVRFEYREALAMIAQDHRPGDVLIYEPFYLEPIVLYYLPTKVPAFPFPEYGANEHVRRSRAELDEDLVRTVGPSKRAWVVLGFQDIPAMKTDARRTVAWFERNGFELAQTYDFNRVQVLRWESDGRRGPIDLMEVTP